MTEGEGICKSRKPKSEREERILSVQELVLSTFLLLLIPLWSQNYSQESSNHWLWLFQSVQIKIYMGIGDRYMSHVAMCHLPKHLNSHWTGNNSNELGINTLGIHTTGPNATAVSYLIYFTPPKKILPLFFSFHFVHILKCYML